MTTETTTLGPGGGRTDAGTQGPEGDREGRGRWSSRVLVFAKCILAGLTICLSIPPFGWWPLAFFGIFQWDRLLAGQPWVRRLRRTWLIAAAWLFPSMLWMFDLTEPGYFIACASYAGFFAAFVALVPAHRPARWIALPGAIALGELLRWSWPFEGVPLATLAMSQADAPLAQTARIGNAIVVSALVSVGGVMLSALYDRRYRAAAVAGGIVVACFLVSLVAPRGHDTRPLRIAVVQGGGIQRTGTGNVNPRAVFDRHLDASTLIDGPVDLVLWPENVVEVSGKLPGTPEDRQLSALARRLKAPVIVGVTEGEDQRSFHNSAVVYLPDGSNGERFEKVTRVPFGEWVPLRPLIESVAGASGIPSRDAIAGTEPAVVDTPAGPMGVAVSWEVFFTDRGSDSAKHGAEVLLNPTNGSSYWLNEIQTQQLASSRLRSIETGRFTVQSAPTGFSTIIDPNGETIDCRITTAPGTTREAYCQSDNSDQDRVSGRAVLEATIMRREGGTIAVAVGVWPVLVLAIGAVAGGWVLDRRRAGGDGPLD